MKFAHLAETYKATFESRNNNQRVQNPASSLFQKEILALHPEWERNEWQGYSAYADTRIFDGKSHDEAMTYIEKYIDWRGPVPKVEPVDDLEKFVRDNRLDW